MFVPDLYDIDSVSFGGNDCILFDAPLFLDVLLDLPPFDVLPSMLLLSATGSLPSLVADAK